MRTLCSWAKILRNITTRLARQKIWKNYSCCTCSMSRKTTSSTVLPVYLEISCSKRYLSKPKFCKFAQNVVGVVVEYLCYLQNFSSNKITALSALISKIFESVSHLYSLAYLGPTAPLCSPSGMGRFWS